MSGERIYPRRIRRTIWRRLRILWLLWRLSRLYPTQRFGQIVHNYGTAHPEGSGVSLFYTEDWHMIERFKDQIEIGANNVR